MDDPFLPWWLVLLLGMWGVALTLWRHRAVDREFRLWAGLATLVYCGMIFLALGGRGQLGATASVPVSDILLYVLIAISLTASVWTISRFVFPSRQLAYVLLVLANSSLCFYWHQVEVGLGLLVIAGLNSVPLVRTFAGQKVPEFRELFVQFTRFPFTRIEGSLDLNEDENPGESILTGGLTCVAALLLLGTVSYGERAETSRAVSSPRHSILPSPDLLAQIFPTRPQPERAATVGDLILGIRSDVVVLLMVIIFLNLAMTMTAHANAAAPTAAEPVLSVDRAGDDLEP